MLRQPLLSRRELLNRSFNGIGALALGGMLLDDLRAADAPPRRPLAPRPTHHVRKAKHCRRSSKTCWSPIWSHGLGPIGRQR